MTAPLLARLASGFSPPSPISVSSRASPPGTTGTVGPNSRFSTSSTRRPSVSELRQHLTDARDLIEGHGWVQKKLGVSEEGFCLVGSLVQATDVAMNRHRQ